MGQKKLAHRSKVKPFIKVRSSILYLLSLISQHSCDIVIQVINYSHLFPTRYALELEGLKGAVSIESFKEPSQRENAKKTIKKLFEDRYTSGKNKWFFEALRVSSRPSHFFFS
jgi:large subunit ribosomal protein L27e